MKIQISMDDELVARLDEYVKKNYTSRSGFISQACLQSLNTQALYSSLIDMSIAMKKIADTGSVDDETMQQIRYLETLLKYVKLS